LGPLEAAIYRLCRVDPASEMSWKTYLAAVVTFTFVSIAALFALLCTQQWLPLNPQHFPNLRRCWRSTSRQLRDDHQLASALR